MTIFRDKVCWSKDAEDADVFWYAEFGTTSEPDLTDEKLALHDKYGCCSYLRIIYTVKISGGQERHYAYCGGCAKEMSTSLRHKVTADSIASTVIYFGRHKGKKLSEVPKSYLEWYLAEGSDKSIKRKIEAFLTSPISTRETRISTPEQPTGERSPGE